VLPDRPQHARAGPVRLAPRPAPRRGHWGLGGLRPVRLGPDEPVILGERAPRVGAAAAAADATLAASRSDRGRDRLALQASLKLTERPRSNFFKPVPRDAAAATAQRLADLRALRDDQRAKEAEVAAKEAEHQHWWPTRRDGHAGAGSMDVALPLLYAAQLPAGTLLGQWQVGAKAECGGRCLGGGSLGQRQHKSIGLNTVPCCSPSHKFVGPDRSNHVQTGHQTHPNLVRTVRYESGLGGLRPPVQNAKNSNSV
jgi:hypothetical protein